MRSDLAAILARPIAHRGLHDREHGVIENSIRAAEEAVSRGYGIECDIQLTRDGEAVVFHDETLDRLTDDAGRIDERIAADLCTIALCDSDDVIPTLPLFLARLGGRVPLVIEIKSRFDGDTRLAGRALAALATYEGPVALKSFDPAILAQCRLLGAPYPVGLVGPVENERRVTATYDFLSWHIGDLHRLHATPPVHPLMTWTVRTRNDEIIAARHGAQIVFEHFRPDR